MLTRPSGAIGDYKRSAIGFSVSLPDRGAPPPPPNPSAVLGDAAPLMKVTATYKPRHVGERPAREEIIAVMREQGWKPGERVQVTDTTFERDEAQEIARLRAVTSKGREEDEQEIHVCGAIWTRWDDAVKTFSVTQEVEVSYLSLVGSLLKKNDPAATAALISACASWEAWKAFVGAEVLRDLESRPGARAAPRRTRPAGAGRL